ncbi:MAG: CgeB family protein [Pyrinomonadaceae bacterium]
MFGSTGKQSGSYAILAPGFAKWWGSDARALAQAFRGLSHSVLDIDEEDYISWRPRGTGSKIIRRLFSRVSVNDYNRAVLEQASSSSYDFILSYKGNSLKPETVRQLRQSGKPLYNFYPDVSFQDHGPNIPASLALYDCVFTTKSFHGEREIRQFGIRDLKHVRHGFDPEVHRPISLSPATAHHYGSDVSFVGCWSPQKEERLLHLLRQDEGISIKVYGIGWNHASVEFRRRMGSNLKPGVFGDELSMVYCASKVNLGLLSCSTSDPQVCDQTTARTFQIPATKSFMLHEDTSEVRGIFEEDSEVVLFRDNEEMVARIKLALSSPAIRKNIRRRGYERCLSEPYDYLNAAESILRYVSGNPGPKRSA